MNRNPCPKIDFCEVPIESLEQFKDLCLLNWKTCFCNQAKLPREWKKQVLEEQSR